MSPRDHRHPTLGRVLRTALIALVAAAGAALAAPGALATTPAAHLTITSTASPTHLVPGAAPGTDYYTLVVTNTGAAPTSGAPITITDELPPGMTANPGPVNGTFGVTLQAQWMFQSHGTPCTPGPPVTCTLPVTLQPGDTIMATIPLNVDASAPTPAVNQATVSGGGAPDASMSETAPVTSTPASPGFQSITSAITDAAGAPDTQAGSHPYALRIGFQLNTIFVQGAGSSSGSDAPVATPQDIHAVLPAGLVINPTGTSARCTEDELQAGTCPDAAAVGVAHAHIGFVGYPDQLFDDAVYNMVPPPGVPAELGFNVSSLGIDAHLLGGVNTAGNYELTADTNDLPQFGQFSGLNLELWGNPSDPSHDPHRGKCAAPDTSPGTTCPVAPDTAPFLTMPSACSGPLTTTLSVTPWEDPANVVTDSAQTEDETGDPVGVTGCDSLDFEPSITVQPDTSVADSPSGLQVNLSVPQNQGQSTLAEANLKDTTVVLPAGMSVNPSAANGLTACTPAQIGLHSAAPPACPDASKIGSVQIDTPLLSDPLTGGVYLAQQSNNPFNSLLAIYVTAEADGAQIKLAGQVATDPLTGQLTTTFDDNPQLPFSDFELDFFGGPQAALATPERCGTYTSNSSFTPWSGTPAVATNDSFQINSGCVTGFSPTLTAGTQNAQAGAYAPFVLSLSRSDTDQNFSGLSVKLPPGMLAKLAGVQECSDAQLASISSQPGTAANELANPTCPAGSQVGTVTTGAGVGPDPFFLSGKAYLTGPYKGAPYGLAIVVPAVAGPFDLGTVVVRQALDINPTTTQVTDVSDPLPTILDGIPLDIRRIDVNLNRPDFTINPTSCDPMTVTGTTTSTQGTTASLSSRFQVGGCQDIGFSPKLKIALSGKGKTRSGDHPTLTATLTDRSGQANLRSAKVTLPLSMALDPNNSQHVCAYATAAAVHGGAVGCPTKTIVGKATADTPLLSKPLTGNVYLVQGLRCAKGNISAQGSCPGGKTAIHTLPSLLVPLRGQIALDLRAKSSVNGAGALVTTFATIPDAPVSKFTLQITGGKKGLLVITGRGLNICAKKQVASENLGAQSGKSMVADDTLTTPCSKAKAKKSERGHRTKKQ